MAEDLKATAYSWWSRGFNVVPFIIPENPEDKHPIVDWTRWETDRQTSEDFNAFPWSNANGYAVICGKPNDKGLSVAVVDFDVKKTSPEAQETGRKALGYLRVTAREKTVSSGEHLVYLTPVPVKTIGAYHDTAAIELLGEKKLCVMSPSKGYSKINDNLPSEVDHLETEFYQALRRSGVSTPGKKEKTPDKVFTLRPIRPCFENLMKKETLSHDERVALVVELEHSGKTRDEIIQIFQDKQAWHAEGFKEETTEYQIDSILGKYDRYTKETLSRLKVCFSDCPHLGLTDCRETTIQKPNVPAVVTTMGDGEKKGTSHADLLVMLCLAQKPILFHDQHKTPYAKIVQNKVNVTIPIRSRQFKSWLAGLLWQAKQKAPGSEALMSSRNVLEAMALHDGNQCVLYNRVAPAEDGIWIDMSDARWRAIKVTADGWCIVDNPPILFRRYSHQKPLPEPICGGSVWRFLDFINLEKDDEKTRLVLIASIVSYLVPEIPHVILVLYGIQGSGKSVAFKLIRRLIDPSSVETLTMPRDENERVQQLAHHWCAFYDNQTQIPAWISDTLCRAATGGGFTKRELYTDDEDIIYEFMRCVGINGINIAAQRGDLLDRSVLIGLKDIPTDKRREEKVLLAEFESCKAEILGGVLDALSKAIKLYPTINPPKLFRMADYTRWGCAITQALGKNEKDFLDAYEAKVNAQIEEAAQSSVVATVLLDFMANRNEWEDTPSKLYKELTTHAKNLDVSTHQKSWPRAPHVLVRQLNELIPALKALGLTVETGIRTGSEGIRRIYMKSVSSVSNASFLFGADATDGTLLISSRSTSQTCEVCGEPAIVTVVRNGTHYFCAKCRDEWEGNL